MHLFTGSGVALVTPFENNQINYEALERLINWHVANQTDALIICGTTGESATLSTEEKKALIAFAVAKTDGRMPVIAGTGCNNTADTIEMSIYAEQAGADGLLIVTPYYNKCTQKGPNCTLYCHSRCCEYSHHFVQCPGKNGREHCTRNSSHFVRP